ncbi:MAG: O-antigen ligase family protein [Acidimicrobiales bacterium]
MPYRAYNAPSGRAWPRIVLLSHCYRPVLVGYEQPAVAAVHSVATGPVITLPRNAGVPVAVRRSGLLRRGAPLALAYLGMATVSFNSTRVAGWSVSDLLFLGSVAAVAARLLSGVSSGVAPSEARRSSPTFLVGSLLLLTSGALSSLWAIDQIGSMMSVLRFGWLTLVWFWLLRTVTPDRASLVWLIRGYRATVLISSAIAMLAFAGLITLAEGPSWENRQAGFYGHSNQLGALLAVGLPFFLVDIRSPESPDRSQPVTRRLIAAGLVVVGIGSTGSISAMFGAALGVAVLGLVRLIPNRRQHGNPLKAIAVIVVVATAGLAFAQSGSPVVERISRYVSGDTYLRDSVSTRTELNDYVIDNIGDRMVIGTGLDQLATVRDVALIDLPDDAPPGGVHNMYLKLLHEAGLPALCGLLLLLIATANRSWRLILHTRGSGLHPIAVALLASLVAANVTAQFQPIAWERFYWLPIAMVSVMWALCRTELRDARSSAGSR